MRLKTIFLSASLLAALPALTEAQTIDFSDPAQPVTQVGRGTTGIANGVFHAKTAFATFGDKGLRDYTFSFRARNPKSADQVQIWASFRAANRYDRYVVGIKGGLMDEVYLMRLGYMGTDEFMGERPLRFHPVPGEWYKIRVEAVGNRVRVFVGDEKLPYIDVTDKNGAAVATGQVGLGGGWIETEYDDLDIKPLAAASLQGVSDEEFNPVPSPAQREQKRQKERAAYKPIEVKQVSSARTEVSLDGDWLFMPGYQMNDKDKAIDASVADQDWHVLQVPNFWNPIRIWLHGETMPSPRGPQPKGVSDVYYQKESDRCENYTFRYRETNSAWYRQWVDLPAGVKGKVMTLQFDAVSKTADIYVNGKLAGSHVGMFGEIDVDVTKLMHPGRNLIAVRVKRSKDNNLDKDNDAVDAFYNQAQGNAVRGGTEKKQEKAKPTNILVDMPHGFYCGDPAGIWQPVKLVITNPVKVEDVFIKSNLHGADFDLTLKNHAAKAGTLQVRTRITDKATGELLYEGTSLPRVQLKGGQEQTLTYSIANLQPKLWSPDHPNLYNFQFTVTDAKSHVIDTKTITSGFRTFQAKDGYLWLNGVKYWLRGGNHVPSAICPNDSVLAHKFFRLMRQGNVMATRTHTSPFNELWMKAADEEGIAVSYEGTWTWFLLGDTPIPNQDLIDMYEHEWLSLLKKYRNHPSLIMWTVNNEMKFYDLDPNKERAKKKMVIVSDLVKEMRKVDPTRPMVYDSNYHRVGQAAKYGQAFMDSIDDGDADDIHAYYNWYDNTMFQFFKGEFQRDNKYPGRVLISQEMSTGYPNNETGHPTRSYQLIHQNPFSFVGYNCYDFSDPKYFLSTLSLTTGELGEALRRTTPEGSGIMQFAVMSWFQQCYDARHIKPWPVFTALSRTMQPVLVSAELWGRNVYAGTPLTTRFYVVNDREDGSTVKTPTLSWLIQDEQGNILKKGHEQLPDIVGYQHYFMTPAITLPAISQDKINAKLVINLTEGGKQISHNEYNLVMARPELNVGKVKAARITVLGDASSLDFLKASYREATTVKDLLRKTDLAILSGDVNLSADDAALIHKYEAKGGHLLVLNDNKAVQTLYPEYLKSWFTPTEGDYAYMEKDEDPVFDGLDELSLRFFNDNQREVPTVCNSVLKTVRNDNVEELAGHMKVHAYIDGGTPEDRLKRIDNIRGYTLLRIHDGKGSTLVSTMCTEKASTDPIAGQLLVNMINNQVSK